MGTAIKRTRPKPTWSLKMEKVIPPAPEDGGGGGGGVKEKKRFYIFQTEKRSQNSKYHKTINTPYPNNPNQSHRKLGTSQTCTLLSPWTQIRVLKKEKGEEKRKRKKKKKKKRKKRKKK